MSLLWLLVFTLLSLNPATALFCWHLPPEHRKNEDLMDKNYTILQKIDCPLVEQMERKGGPIYGCITRVDKGEVRMDCLDHKDKESVKLCEKAVELGKERCNFNAKALNFGYGHKNPGHGVCCCPDNECNVVPPVWLHFHHHHEGVPSWRRDIDNACFCIVVVTLMMILVAMEAVVEAHVRMWWARRQKAALRKEEAPTPDPDLYSVRDALDEGEIPFETQEVTSKNITDPKKVDQKQAKSNGVNGTQSSHILDMPLDKTPETTPEGMKTSVVLDSTQPTTRLQRKSNIKSGLLAKKSPSLTFGQLKKSNKKKTSGISTQKMTSTTAPSATDVTQPENS